jgi:hypothetical protein
LDTLEALPVIGEYREIVSRRGLLDTHLTHDLAPHPSS